MSTEELSNEFDTILNSYGDSFIFGSTLEALQFDEYEKSLFLTKALETLILSYYSTTSAAGSFETTEELRRYLDNLVCTEILVDTDLTATPIADSYKHFVYKLPVKTWFIVYELVKYFDSDSCIKNIAAEVLPVTHDAYFRTVLNPFRGPSRRRVLRLDKGNNSVEIVSKYNIQSYTIRYLKEPSPIILVDLGDVTINGEHLPKTCELNTNLHRRIVELAVQLAVLSRVRETKTT